MERKRMVRRSGMGGRSYQSPFLTFMHTTEPFKHNILGGLLSFEILGSWRRLCVLRKRLTRKSSSKTTYLKVVQDKQSHPDLFPRLWSNLAYLGRLSRTSSAWTTFKTRLGSGALSFEELAAAGTAADTSGPLSSAKLFLPAKRYNLLAAEFNETPLRECARVSSRILNRGSGSENGGLERIDGNRHRNRH
ncbi:hypothetical protein YC2023_114933 [Brassica napus]